MDEVLKFIGAVVLAIIILGIPVLFTLSLIFSWPGFVMILLFVFTFADVIISICVIHDGADFFD